MKILFLLLLSALILGCYQYVVAESSHKKNAIDKKSSYTDSTYDAHIRTVLLYPNAVSDNPVTNALNQPVVGLRDNTPLRLEFDLLSERYESYRAKIYHCNANWTPSVLAEVEYLPEYNDFNIQDYQISYATKVPYYHYTFELPKVKLSGNYILMVYKDGNVRDIAFTRRFMVFDNQVGVAATINYSSGIMERRTHQQIDFQLKYGSFPVINPSDDFKIVIRQNGRWDKVIKDLRPSMVFEGERKLEYRFFDLENNFWGGNEFRMFDARSIRTKLVNVSQIISDPDQSKIVLYTDTPQGSKAYIDVDDFDGGYVIDQYESHKGETESDYVRVTFTLKSPELIGKEIFVRGKFNDWAINANNRLTYFDDKQAYQASIELKQGIYNYQYVAKDLISQTIDERLIEGSHAQTRNSYEIFVYGRPMGARSEQLVGYVVVSGTGQ
jgi:Domain of unknown function (DUF5103)